MTSPTETSPRLAEIERELARHRHGRVPRELRARQLLEIATEQFSRRGYAAVSMDELARAAGVSKPVIYDLFGSKEGLLVECLDVLGRELNETVIAAVSGREDPEELLRAGSLAFFRFVGERRDSFAMAFGAIRAVAETSERAAAKVAEIRDRQGALVAAVLSASARRLGGDPDSLQLSGLTRALNGAYEGLVDWWESHPEVSAETLTDWVIALVLPGLLALGGETAEAPRAAT